MYVKGMTSGYIERYIQNIYGISVFDSTVQPDHRSASFFPLFFPYGTG